MSGKENMMQPEAKEVSRRGCGSHGTLGADIQGQRRRPDRCALQFVGTEIQHDLIYHGLP